MNKVSRFVVGEQVILHNFNSVLYDGRKAIITKGLESRDVIFANKQDVVWKMFCYVINLPGVNSTLSICAKPDQLLKCFPSIVNRECDTKSHWSECVWAPQEMH